MAMPRADDKLVSADELAHMRIEEPCELVEGRIVRMSPAGSSHGLVASRFHHLLTAHCERTRIGEVVSAETGFLVRRKPDTVRAPDVAFVSNELVARAQSSGETFFPQAPDLAVEVLSPDDAWTDVERKVREYLQAGAKAVWVASPPAERVYVYAPARPVRVLGVEDEVDAGDAVPGFRAPVASFFRRP